MKRFLLPLGLAAAALTGPSEAQNQSLLIPLALGYILLRVVWFVPIMMVRQWRADGRGSRNPYTPAATPASVPCARSLHLVRAPGEPPQAHARLAHPSPSACL